MATAAEMLYAGLRSRLSETERDRARQFVFDPARHIPQATRSAIEGATPYANELLSNDSHDILVKVACDTLRERLSGSGHDAVLDALVSTTAGMLDTEQISASVTARADGSSRVVVDRGVLSVLAALSQLTATMRSAEH